MKTRPVIPDDRPTEKEAPDSTAIERFRQSMHVTYEMWHDGIGYDLDALEAATVDERAAIEAQLVGRGITDWRDVEALVAIATDRALDVVWARGRSTNPPARAQIVCRYDRPPSSVARTSPHRGSAAFFRRTYLGGRPTASTSSNPARRQTRKSSASGIAPASVLTPMQQESTYDNMVMLTAEPVGGPNA